MHSLKGHEHHRAIEKRRGSWSDDLELEMKARTRKSLLQQSVKNHERCSACVCNHNHPGALNHNLAHKINFHHTHRYEEALTSRVSDGTNEKNLHAEEESISEWLLVMQKSFR